MKTKFLNDWPVLATNLIDYMGLHSINTRNEIQVLIRISPVKYTSWIDKSVLITSYLLRRLNKGLANFESSLVQDLASRKSNLDLELTRLDYSQTGKFEF